MNAALILALIIGTVQSCNVQKEATAYEEAISPYYVEGRLLYKGETVIGKVLSTEYEMIGDNIYQEISIGLTTYAILAEVEDIMRFLRKKYPKAKLELNIDELEK
jgi:hypothetical protein